MSRWDPDPEEIRDVRPYDFEGAKRAIARQSRDQAAAEDFMRECARNYAQAEEAYRLALAKTIVEVHAGGAAWTVAQDLARGEPHVASLRRERDIAEGMKEAAAQGMWRHTANRRELEQLIEWSMKVEAGRASDPAESRPSEVIGRRAA